MAEERFQEYEAPKNQRELRQERRKGRKPGGFTDFLITILIAFVLVLRLREALSTRGFPHPYREHGPDA